MLRRLRIYFRWLYDHSAGVRWRIAANILLACVNIGLNLLFIYVCKQLVDIATGVREGDLLTGSCMAGGVVLLRIVFSAMTTWLENITSSRMTFILRARLFSEVIQSRWYGRERMHTGDLTNRLESDVNTVTDVICSILPEIMTTLLQLLAATWFLALMDWRLALLLLLMTPLLLLISKVFFRRMRTLTRRIRETESQVQSHIQESLRNRLVIKSLEQESATLERLGDYQDAELGQVEARARMNIASRSIVSLAFSAGYLSAFLWGVYGIQRGTASFGMMTAFLQLVGQIQRPAVNLTRQVPALIYASASVDRLMELEGGQKEVSGHPILLKGVAGIRIDHLRFRYPDGKRNVIDGLTLDFAPGSRTAIFGETGAGKSTLVRLILALLHPEEGTVELYDDTRSVTASARTRCNLVYVPQGNSLLSGTIRDNLRMGDPAAGDEQMLEALDVAAAGFVRDLPEGLDTPCGEGGSGLSEGQAQRIAIARALLRPGSILLLDEFSSSLDPATEEKLLDNLTHSERAEGKTMVFITHREKIAAYCDAVIHLKRR